MKIADNAIERVAKLEFNSNEPGYVDGLNSGIEDMLNEEIALVELVNPLTPYYIAYLVGYVAGIREACQQLTNWRESRSCQA